MNDERERFENDVNRYGTQTLRQQLHKFVGFENDVNRYGTQTLRQQLHKFVGFENDVNRYGTQTFTFAITPSVSLRMM